MIYRLETDGERFLLDMADDDVRPDNGTVFEDSIFKDSYIIARQITDIERAKLAEGGY